MAGRGAGGGSTGGSERTQPLDARAAAEPAGFGAGAAVRITQFEVGARGNHVRTLGFGRLHAAPSLDAPLEIGLRNDRGLLSSRVTALQPLADGYLAVVTSGRVYLLQRTDAADALAPAARTDAEALLAQAAPAPDDPNDQTTFARLKTAASSGELAAFCDAPLQVTRRRGEGEPEVVGTGEILSDPVQGEPLRFSVDGGGVLATTDVLGLGVSGLVLEVRTANSTYWFERPPDGTTRPLRPRS